METAIDEEDKSYLKNQTKPQGFYVITGFIAASRNAIKMDPETLSPEMIDIIDQLEEFCEYDGPAYEPAFKALSRAVKILVVMNISYENELIKEKYSDTIRICGLNILLIMDTIRTEIEKGKFDFEFCEVKFSEIQLVNNISSAVDIDKDKLLALWYAYNKLIEDKKELFTILQLQVTHIIGSLLSDANNDNNINDLLNSIKQEFWIGDVIPDKLNQIKLNQLSKSIAMSITDSSATIEQFAAEYNIPQKYMSELEITTDEVREIAPTADTNMISELKGQ